MSSAATDLPPSFDLLPLSAEVRRAVDDLGYQVPTPVQQAVFEAARSGADLVVQARTGTGKTAAFGLPLVDGLVKRGSSKPQAIVLCPTRELALQVTREVTALGQHTGLTVACVYGGAAMNPQIDALKKGVQIVVGTPGRVLDHMARGTLDVSGVRVLVLDESDEMLSMGFLPQIDKVWTELPKALQVLLFSATLPREVRRIADSRLKQPQFITLSGDSVGALEIRHFVYLSRGNKHDELLQILEIDNPESAIVFCNTRDETKQVAATLQAQGFAADWLNADLPQNEREAVMRRTREGKLRFLVCTDVAARGIDISHLTHVINFDFPESTEQYVHRTGRTGRAGRTGTAISLVEPGQLGNLYFLRLQYKIRPIEKQLPSALELRTRAETDVITQLAHDLRQPPASELLALSRRLLTHDDAERLVGGLLGAHLATRDQPWAAAQTARRSKMPAPVPVVTDRSEQRRAPARRSHASDEQAPRNERPAREARPAANPARKPKRRDEPKPRTSSQSGNLSQSRDVHEEEGFRYEVHDAEPRAPQPVAADAPARDFKEAYVNVGKKDGASEDELRALLQQHGIAGSDIKRITVRFKNSFVQVAPAVLGDVIAALNGKTIGERQLVAEESRSRT